MATFRKSCQLNKPDANVFPDVISNQITTSNPIGNFIGYISNDAVGVDNGCFWTVNIPKNYIGSPVLVIKVLLDGAPGASDVLGFAVTGLAVANNESEDQAFSSQDIASATIGSGGLNYSNEDMLEMTITLTNLGTLAVDDLLFLYVVLDVSVTDYAGNVIWQSVELQYSDS